MLPAPKTDRISIADVLPSCLAAVAGQGNRLGLRRVSKAVVLLVDGLGAAALAARAGHARTLAGALRPATTIDSGFPTTTASALTTLTTGVAPGEHGMVGYSVLDSANDRVVNQLSGWDDAIDPRTWQAVPTLFERATASGVRAGAVGPERYRDSDFSAAVLRGAEYISGATIQDRFDAARAWLSAGGDGILYVYVPELDTVAHAHGWESSEWTERLELLDGAVRSFAASLRADEGLLVTADHGVVDIPNSSHVVFDTEPGLVEGVRHIAGEPRCLQLYFEPDLSENARNTLVERWRESESSRSWVATRSEAIAANWFGPVRPHVAPRIGDLLVAARKAIAYYDSSPASLRGRSMIGQHGSWSPAEVRVPLLRFGAFAR
ncbi:MAG: hypothetical protein JWQ12_252 [Glaciihabitans sp.]|nr:hypothetical protein [Glaciihabitans sp.]